MTTMKAARVEQWGGSEAVNIKEIERPEAGAGKVLIAVKASSVNPVDWKMREGYLAQAFPAPITLGCDIAGDIVAVGEGVTDFKVGDAVYGFAISGAFAEYAVLPAASIALKPTSVNYAQAAALPVAALTAWQGLFEIANLSAGQTVLIHAAAGGVGNFAVQFARWKGAHVIGTASAANADFVRELGADEFIDYRSTRFEEVVSDVEVVFDAIGGETLERSYAVVKPGGTLVTAVGQPSPDKAQERGIKTHRVSVQSRTDDLTELARLIDAGTLKVYISETLPFAQVRQALDLNQTGHTRGKIVLTMNGA